MPRFPILAVLVTALLLPLVTAAREPVRARAQMVVAGHPLAAEAGRAVLREGGNAVDATVAMAMVLGLVEPQESGLGGGGILLLYDARSHAVTAYDGREAAPAAASPEIFARLGRSTEPFVGGLATGVPGQLRMLETAHEAHGRLPWASAMKPAVALAVQGFPLSPRVRDAAEEDIVLRRFPASAQYLLGPGGGARRAGETMQNAALRDTLRAIAQDGAKAFYGGPIAQDIAAAVARAPMNPATLTADDLGRYTTRAAPAVCRAYRMWRICAAPPPASGITALEILGILGRFDIAALPPSSAASVHLIAEASRLAYADRLRWLRDPVFGQVPVQALLDPAYLARRAALISPDEAIARPRPGDLPGRRATLDGSLLPELLPEEHPSTTQILAVDRDGNAAALTTTVGGAFGSKIMVRGFFLNDAMNSFTRDPAPQGERAVNAVEPGKRPRTSMTPVMVLDRDGRLVLALGSPGGSRIFSYVIKALIGLLDQGLDPQAAVELPNHSSRTRTTEVEHATALAAAAPELRRLGHEVEEMVLPSGIHVVRLGPGGIEAGVDPRREGAALGD